MGNSKFEVVIPLKSAHKNTFYKSFDLKDEAEAFYESVIKQLPSGDVITLDGVQDVSGKLHLKHQLDTLDVNAGAVRLTEVDGQDNDNKDK